MPADHPEYHAKAQELPADGLLFDLEDSIAVQNKNAAREAMVDSLSRFPFTGKVVSARINSRITPWFEDDLATAIGCARIESVVIPKVRSVHDLTAVERHLAQSGRRVAIEVQIETAEALERIGEIAGASALVAALHFGPFDLAAALGTFRQGSSIADEVYTYAIVRILVAARAAGLDAFDGPFTDLHDVAGLNAAATRAARAGYDGKWAIHPRQIEVINQAFRPDESAIRRARDIVSACELATSEGRGVATLDGEMLDEATRSWAQRILARKDVSSRG